MIIILKNSVKYRLLSHTDLIYVMKNKIIVYFSYRLLDAIRYVEYLCNVFFIVLDLRLTKVGAQRSPFFYDY